MNKYTFHVRMHGKNGAPSHTVHGEHHLGMEALAAELNENTFIVINQFVVRHGAIEYVGQTCLNERVIGKIRPFREQDFDV